LDVATSTDPRWKSSVNSRDRIIASAMSVTVNSSKQSSTASSCSAAATGGTGSACRVSPFFSFCR
jgi:hypothetical protein